MEGVEFGIVTEIDDEEKVTENEMKLGFVTVIFWEPYNNPHI